MSQESVREFRQSLLSKIPEGYQPTIHLLLTAGSCVLVMMVAMIGMSGSTWSEWLITSPLVVLYAHFFEYIIHRYVFHKKLPGVLGVFFKRHTEHHQRFNEHGMEIEKWRELFNVLMPWYAIIAFLVIAGFGAWAIGNVFGNNVGWIVFFWQGLYVGSYEILHMLYHMPAMNEIVSVLSRRHTYHHHHQTWNYGITGSLFDRVFKTLAK